MATEWMRLGGLYGKSADNTCTTSQPGAGASLDILYSFTAIGNGPAYDLAITFASSAKAVTICNSDPAGAPERSFFVELPIDLHQAFSNYLMHHDNKVEARVGTHLNGMIEFFLVGNAGTPLSE